MIRSRASRAAALALAAGLACTKTTAPAAGARFLQPEDLAVFLGVTIEDPAHLRPYTVIANASRNDLSLVDGVTDVAIPAPIQLQTLVVPVADRPARLAAASLGDGKADVLVVVSGGTSVLQLVETWNTANTVDSDPSATPRRAVDLGHDVIALAAVPPDPGAPGTARIAAALADQRVAVVTYVRGGDGESIQLAGDPAVSAAPLGFQPLAIAAMPDDPGTPGLQTALYVATLDPVAPGIHGAAEISLDLSTVRALGARGPTRLVAAARLRERFQPDPATASAADLSRSAASDGTAFDGQPLVPRVYAVLDESGCGPTKPIDCGVVVLDPTLDPTASTAQNIPPDYSGVMPYRAPIRLPGRALRMAASGAPFAPPPKVSDTEPDWTNGLMRIYMGATWRATTGVAAVATDTGAVYFLDLGRFELETIQTIVQTMGTGWASAKYVDNHRLWIEKLEVTPPVFGPETNPASASDAGAASAYIGVTPGYAQDESWSVSYQGPLSSDVAFRAAEAGLLPPGQLWIALQVGDGVTLGPGRIVNSVVELWRPELAVRPNDIVVIPAKGMPAGCVGTNPPGTPATADPATVDKEFELRIGALLLPTSDYPGGALSMLEPSASDPAEWSACYAALTGAVTSSTVWTGLVATVRAQGLVAVGSQIGYVGRPSLDVPFELTYLQRQGGTVLNEDALAALCPLAGWDGSLPAPACDAACRDTCEQLVLARKARRYANLSVDCSTSADASARTTCAALWPGNTFPLANGPVLRVQVGVQTTGNGSSAPARDLAVGLSTGSGVFPSSARGASTSPTQASGMVAFDRSPWDATAGYRFLVSYPTNFALDTTAGQWPPPAAVIR